MGQGASSTPSSSSPSTLSASPVASPPLSSPPSSSSASSSSSSPSSISSTNISSPQSNSNSSLNSNHHNDVAFADVDRTTLYVLMPLGRITVASIVYPAQLVKTRLQAAPQPSTRPSQSHPHPPPHAHRIPVNVNVAPIVSAPTSAAATVASSSSASLSSSSFSPPSSSASASPHPHPVYRGTWDALRTIVRQEGFRALYKGFWLTMLGLPIGPVYITTLEQTRHTIKTKFLDPRFSPNSPEHRVGTFAASFISGGLSSIVAQSLLVPLDVVTQRLQVQRNILPGTAASSPSANSSLTSPSHTFGSSASSSSSPSASSSHPANWRSIVRDIMARDGIGGFWRGYGLSILLAAPMSSIVWSVFSLTHDTLRRFVPASETTVIAFSDGSSNQWTGFGRELFLIPVSAATASTVAAIITQPLDVVKTRIQLNESREDATVRQTVSQVIREQGRKGLYVGLNARILSMAPASAMLMLAYETLKRVAFNPEKHQQRISE